MVFLTMADNTSSIKEDWKNNNTQGLCYKTNFQSQTFSQVDKGL
jgi:hypothetical protein